MKIRKLAITLIALFAIVAGGNVQAALRATNHGAPVAISAPAPAVQPPTTAVPATNLSSPPVTNPATNGTGTRLKANTAAIVIAAAAVAILQADLWWARGIPWNDVLQSIRNLCMILGPWPGIVAACIGIAILGYYLWDVYNKLRARHLI